MVQTDTTEATTVDEGLRQAAMSDDELRQTLGESFTIFNATISMCSLFLGFIYFALLGLLAGDNDFSNSERWACRCLVLGFLAMLGALMGFHVTAHQVYRYWRLFFPTSRIQRLARMFFQVSLVSMLLAAAAMLWHRGMYGSAILISAAGAVFWPFGQWVGRIHKGANYIRDMDKTPRSPDPGARLNA